MSAPKPISQDIYEWLQMRRAFHLSDPAEIVMSAATLRFITWQIFAAVSASVPESIPETPTLWGVPIRIDDSLEFRKWVIVHRVDLQIW